MPSKNTSISSMVDRCADRLLGLATHFVLFFLFTAIFVFAGWIFDITIGPYTLAISFVTYVIGYLLIAKFLIRDNFMSALKDAGIFVGASLLVLAAGLTLFAHTHDTSYDGQAYHQTAIISLMNGWNPLYERKLPEGTLLGTPYAVGYPKILWEQYATFASATGDLNAATAINLVPLFIGFAATFYLLAVVLRLKYWALPLAVLASASIYYAQQIFTFMADGTSYELGLGAIALMAAMFFLGKSPYKLLVPFIGLLIILIGVKFNNAPLVFVLTALFVLHMYRTRLFLSRNFWRFVGASVLVALVVLWSPYMTNYWREKTLVYPQNLSEPREVLLSGNIPPDISGKGPVVQLFYGIFAEAQPLRAGNPDSPENVSKLKIPYTFTQEETQAASDFLGRLASPGVLFGGALVSSMILLGAMYLRASTDKDKKILRYVAIAIGLLVVLGLTNVIPNKLRYAPFITLVPLIIVVGSLVLTKSKDHLLVFGRVVVVLTVLLNIGIATTVITQSRQKDFAAVEAQRQMLAAQPQPISLVTTSFNSIGYQLNWHGVSYERVEKCAAGEQKVPIALGFQTAFYCQTK